jgi:hypothetical protein
MRRAHPHDRVQGAHETGPIDDVLGSASAGNGCGAHAVVWRDDDREPHLRRGFETCGDGSDLDARSRGNPESARQPSRAGSRQHGRQRFTGAQCETAVPVKLVAARRQRDARGLTTDVRSTSLPRNYVQQRLPNSPPLPEMG